MLFNKVNLAIKETRDVREGDPKGPWGEMRKNTSCLWLLKVPANRNNLSSLQRWLDEANVKGN